MPFPSMLQPPRASSVFESSILQEISTWVTENYPDRAMRDAYLLLFMAAIASRYLLTITPAERTYFQKMVDRLIADVEQGT